MPDEYRINVQDEADVPSSSFETQGNKYLFALFGGQFVRISIETLKENFATGGSVLNTIDRNDILMIAQNVLDENEEITGKAINNITVEKLAAAIFSILSTDEKIATADDINSALEHENFVKDVSLSLDGSTLIITFLDGTTTEMPYVSAGGGGLAFDGGYVDEDNKLHLTFESEDIEGFDPIQLPAGGGGGGATGSMMVFAVTSGTSVAVTEADSYISPTVKFTSVVTGTEIDTGNGTLQVYLNDTLYKTISVAQGNSVQLSNLVAVSDLNNDANSVKLVMTDSYGLTATRNITVTKVFLSLNWNIPSDTVINDQATYNINLTPSGGAGIRKTITLHVTGPDDYDETFTKTTTASGTSVAMAITGLTEPGAYVITASCSMVYNGVTMSSRELSAAIAQVMSSSDTAVASPFSQAAGQQYTSLRIPYRVVNGDDVEALVVFKVEDSNGNTVYSHSEAKSTAQQEWVYKPTIADSLTLSITCNGVTWEHEITITPLSIDISEIDDYAYKLDASALSSLSGFTLSSNFDTINGGIQTDSNGNRCLRVMKGDRLTIPYNLFGLSSDLTGKEFKIVYRISNVTAFYATAIQCYSDGIGLNIKANKTEINSSLTSADLQTCEGHYTELDVNVTAKNNYRLITIWEHGKPHKVVQYAADSDKFNQDNPVGITVGSDDCTVDLYLIRAYNKELSNAEILTNWIIDAPDGEEIVNRYDRNTIYSNGVDGSGNPIADLSGSLYKEFVAAKNSKAHIFTINAPGFPVGKSSSNYINGTVDYELRSGGVSRRFANPVAMRYRLQGTSSLDYIGSAGNVDIDIRESIVWADGETHNFKISDNSIPITYINIKVNDASSEHINNIILAEWYNRFQPYKRPARLADQRVRDTVEGDMCIFFYHNTGDRPVSAGPVTVQPNETILYALGNVNNSKKNYDVFGHNDTDDVLVVEINNNIDDKCRFKVGNITGADFGDEKPFGIRYISDAIVPAGSSEEEAAAALWTEFCDFIVSCNPSTATNDDLDEPVTYVIDKAGNTRTFAIDSEAYRIAKFRNEAPDYLEISSFQYHYLFTLFFCMPDNRSKNVFIGYNPITGKWNIVFGYDKDTAMGNNNVGALNLNYGYLDTDHIGHNENAGMVYNAADSTLWELIRSSFPEENKDLFQTLETQGAWNMDAFNELCDSYQAKFCEALWIEDFYTKYVKPLINNNDASFLEKGLGPKTLQRKQFLKFQQPFISSYFISDFSRDNQATFRCYGNSAQMTVTPFSDQFVTFIGGNTVKQVRGFAGVPVTIDISDFSANDTETHIRNAPFIQDLGDLSGLKLATCQFANFSKLKSVILGSTAAGYENAQLATLDVSNCEALETLNIANCSNFGGSTLNLSNNILLKNLTTTGTAITGVLFANGGRVQSAILNAIRSLTMKNINRLSTLQFDAGSLTSLIIENCNYNNVMALLTAAVNLTNLRAIGVALTSGNTTLIKRLAALKGWDADNNEIANSVITGTCYIGAISETVLAQLRLRFNHPDGLYITYGEIVPEFRVLFKVDDEVYETQIIEKGSSATPPEIDPTKASTVAKNYTFASWAGSMNNIQEDTVITAVFTETTRQYTVTYMNGLTPVQEPTVLDYGDSCYYTGADLSLSGYLFDGWENQTTHEISIAGRVSNIEDNVIMQAHFVEPTLPASKVDDYDFLASEDPADYIEDENGRRAAAYTWAEFYAICQAGLALGTNGYFSIKDKIKVIPIKNDVITDESIIYQLIDTKHNEIAESDGEYVSATTWQTVGVLNSARQMHNSNTNVGGYPAMRLATWLDETLPVQFSPLIRGMMERVVRISTAGNQSASKVYANYRSYLATAVEMGWASATEVPYSSEVNQLSERARFAGATGSMVKKTYNGAGTASYWWLASPHSGGSSSFCYFYTTGAAYNNGATGSNYLAPCFDIGKSAVSAAS